MNTVIAKLVQTAFSSVADSELPQVVRFLGVAHQEYTVDRIKEALDELATQDSEELPTDGPEAMFVELPDEHYSYPCRLIVSNCFLRNPLFALFACVTEILVLVLGYGYYYSGLISPDNGDFTPNTLVSEYRAAYEFAMEEDLYWKNTDSRVDMPYERIVRTQNHQWILYSWAGLVIGGALIYAFLSYILGALSSVLAASNSSIIDLIFILLTVLATLGWTWTTGRFLHAVVVNRFTAASNPRRNRYMLANIKEVCQQQEFEDVCLVSGANHLSHFNEHTTDEIGATPVIKNLKDELDDS